MKKEREISVIIGVILTAFAWVNNLAIDNLLLSISYAMGCYTLGTLHVLMVMEITDDEEVKR